VTAAAASAITVTAQLTDVNPGLNVSVHRANNTNVSTRAGVYNFDLISDDGWGALADPFPAFCIDLNQYVWYGGTFSWEVKSPEEAPVPGPDGHPMTSAQHLDLRKLYAMYYVGATTGGSNVESAAFQAAVWEIVWEAPANGYNVDGTNAAARGRIYVNNTWAATGRANDMLQSIGSYTGHMPTLMALVSTTNQDQIVLVPGGGQPPIPEPVTAAGLAMAIAGLARYARKRR